MQAPEVIQVTQYDDGQIWKICINRPHKRNAVDGPTGQALAGALIQFDRDPKSKIAVLCGEGGADLSVVSGGGTAIQPLPIVHPCTIKDTESHCYDTSGPMGFSRLRLLKPVIAAIQGFAVAGGLELACWCDLRVMEQDATLGVFCRRWGVPLIDGGTFRLPQLIGLSRAQDLIMTGRPVQGQECLQIGLANRVVENGTAVEAAINLAREIIQFPARTMDADRLSARMSFFHRSERAALTAEFERGVPTLGDAKDGAKRFAEKKEGRHGSFTSFQTPPAKL